MKPEYAIDEAKPMTNEKRDENVYRRYEGNFGDVLKTPAIDMGRIYFAEEVKESVMTTPAKDRKDYGCEDNQGAMGCDTKCNQLGQFRTRPLRSE